mmetsp:Transcript_97135/g.208338  ORF Transcript_97135/g.208338 Transcript_97135/m.208338 type:complete len:207 (-) Transcript_97135:79-699(-)
MLFLFKPPGFRLLLCPPLRLPLRSLRLAPRLLLCRLALGLQNGLRLSLGLCLQHGSCLLLGLAPGLLFGLALCKNLRLFLSLLLRSQPRFLILLALLLFLLNSTTCPFFHSRLVLAHRRLLDLALGRLEPGYGVACEIRRRACLAQAALIRRNGAGLSSGPRAVARGRRKLGCRLLCAVHLRTGHRHRCHGFVERRFITNAGSGRR